MKPIVLGLDPGTHMGWALYTPDRTISSGTYSFEKFAPKGFGAMFAEFRSFITHIRTESGPLDAIAYELPFSGFGAAITGRITTGMVAHLLERCYAWKCRPMPVNVQTLKKFATGSGKAKKEDMITMLGVLKLLPPGHKISQVSEHEADAIHIARWGVEQLRNGQNK